MARAISYNKLWKLLIDKGWKKSELGKYANISPASIAKLGKGKNITTDVLLRICDALDCDIEDIMKTVKKDDVIVLTDRKCLIYLNKLRALN
ncbi:helix-turn-helix domain-containing protein [Lactococcus petauri]|uniref:helix-turn-helix domain-containing protein n=1 Tax=Lactococcus petauri TaxID=1940789 RepID=UPI0038540CA0